MLLVSLIINDDISVSVVALVVMLLVLINQLVKFATIQANSELTMLQPSYHTIASDTKINITVGIDFVACPCEMLHLEVLDKMGTNNSDAFKDSPYLKRYVFDSLRGVMLGEWIDGTSNDGMEINADMVSESER